ncbi:uncharacterized protein LOC132032031 [Lycium ferocissimum]|uniref:uncharacterized protein LOC132032031 n=1 Tax=Lycium ferocissimum TaxID=112874 RepID=UPI0028153505|nr:uncharacterized protein LOC132032031 [Lycium ferocissimum]
MDGNDKKSRSKAFKIAVSQPGTCVESAAMQGGEHNQLEVEEEQIDAVVLTKLLRKTLKQAELLSVGPVDKKDGDKKEGPKMELVPIMQWPSYNNYPYYVVPQYQFYEVRELYQGGCSIM